jgi:hypothetical protein
MLVLVTGPPGAGKSKLAWPGASRRRVGPLIAKDALNLVPGTSC